MAHGAQLPITLFLRTFPFGLAGPSGFVGDPGEEGPEGLSYGGDPGRVICLNKLHPVILPRLDWLSVEMALSGQ